MRLDPAKNKILSSSLNLGTFVYDKTIVTSTDSLRAFVYKQNPEFKIDATLQLGSNIYLWLTVDSAKLRIDTTKIISDTIKAATTSDNNSN